ncbi:hypothetical protein ACTFIY_009255 [Dictyostelium cf. discoideum]
MKSFIILKLLFLISLFIYSINCEIETKINYLKSIVFITILPNSNDLINNIDLLCLVNLECTYNGAIQGFGSNRIIKNLDGSNSCNSTFDFTGYTDFQKQECKGTLLYKITNRILDEKISIPISFPVEIDDSHLYTNGTSSLKIRYYDGSKANGTPMTITDITGKPKEIKNLKYENSLIYNQPGLLTWTMDPGFGYVLISFGGDHQNSQQIPPYKATYPKPIINSARVLSMDIEKGATKIEFIGINFGTNRKLLTFMPSCYPFPYKISIDYVNSTNLIITDFNRLVGLCPTRDFKYTLCLDNYCGQGQLKEGYPPITINSIEGPTSNRTYKFNGYFLDSTTYSQLTPISQYGQKLSSSINHIEFQMSSPLYYQYTSGGRGFKFWDKNSNGATVPPTSISIPIGQPPSTIFDCGPPTLLSTTSIEQQGKLKVIGKYFMNNDMSVYLDGVKLNQSVITIVNSTIFYISPIPRPGILTVSIDGSNDNSSIPIRINVSIKEISSPTTKGGLITIKGNGLYLSSENGKSLKSKFSIENFNNNNQMNCHDPIENSSYPGEIIYCKVSPGIGKKLWFKLEIGDSKPAIFTNFTYQAPTISKIYQSFDNAIVNGNNLGELNSKVFIYINNEINGKIIVTPLPVLTNSSELIQFQIPDSIKTSMIFIEVGGQKSNQLQLPIIPFITSIPSKLSVNGGIFTIIGKYLNLLNYNIENQNEIINNGHNHLNIKIGSQICKDIQQLDLKHFTSITCKMPPGSGGDYSVSILINDTLVQGNPKGLTFSYMSPTIINSTSVSPTTGGLITIFGSQLAKPINITIANIQQCIYVNITDSNSLTCYLPPLSESLNKSSIERSDHQIQINVNGQSGDADVFKYSIPDKYQFRSDNNNSGGGGGTSDQNNNSHVEKWLIPAILIPCLFFLIAIFVLVIIYIKKYKKRKQIQKRLNEPIPPESMQD